MRKHYFIKTLILIMIVALSSFAENGPKTALIHSNHPFSKSTNYDLVVTSLGWGKPTSLNVHEIDSWIGHLLEYDIIIFNVCYNLPWDQAISLEQYKDYWLAFLENRGIMLITDMAYASQVNWLSVLGWEVTCKEISQGGLVKTTDHPLLTSPHVLHNLTTPWIAFENYDEKWEPIVYSGEEKPLMLIGNQGEGLIIATTYAGIGGTSPLRKEFLENIWLYSQGKGKFHNYGVFPALPTQELANTLFINGEPYMPLGIYHVGENYLEKVAELGFDTINIVVIPFGQSSAVDYIIPWERVDSVLDRALELDLKVIFEYKGDLKDAVKRFGKHPAIVAWYLADEPSHPRGENKLPISPSFLEEKKKAAQAFDSSRPYIIIDDGWTNPEEVFSQYPRVADVYGIDRYPVGWAPMTEMTGRYDLYYQAWGEQNQPFWGVIQAVGGYRPLEIPTLQQVKAMSYLGLIHGAKGFIYYALGETSMPGWEDNDEFWEEFPLLTCELQKTMPMFLGEIPNIEIGFDNSAIHFSVRQDNTGVYLFAVNGTDRQVKTEFYVQMDKDQVEVLFEDRLIQGRQGFYCDDFMPYDVHIYRIK